MIRILAPLALALALLGMAPARAALDPAQLSDVGVTPPADARLPSGHYIDQFGHEVVLGPSRVPTLLLFADYTCQHLCGPGATLTAGALEDAGLRIGRDYRFVVIGLDQDGPAKARAFAATNLHGMPAIARSVLLLTGDPVTVAAAEHALGYHAIYDRTTDQFAHDAQSLLFTPAGRLSRLLPEVGATPGLLKPAMAAAARGEVLSSANAAPTGFVGLCYGFAAAHGLYGASVVLALRLLAFVSLGGIALLVWRFARRRGAAA